MSDLVFSTSTHLLILLVISTGGGTIVAGSISDLWQTSERGPKVRTSH